MRLFRHREHVYYCMKVGYVTGSSQRPCMIRKQGHPHSCLQLKDTNESKCICLESRGGSWLICQKPRSILPWGYSAISLLHDILIEMRFVPLLCLRISNVTWYLVQAMQVLCKYQSSIRILWFCSVYSSFLLISFQRRMATGVLVQAQATGVSSWFNPDWPLQIIRVHPRGLCREVASQIIW